MCVCVCEFYIIMNPTPAAHIQLTAAVWKAKTVGRRNRWRWHKKPRLTKNQIEYFSFIKYVDSCVQRKLYNPFHSASVCTLQEYFNLFQLDLTKSPELCKRLWTLFSCFYVSIFPIQRISVRYPFVMRYI